MLALWLASCGSPEPVHDPEAAVVELFYNFRPTGGCGGGTCPFALAQLDATGRVVVRWDHHLRHGLALISCEEQESDFRTEGLDEHRLEPEAVERILGLADEIGFWDLPPNLVGEGCLPQCSPFNRLTITASGREHTVLFAWDCEAVPEFEGLAKLVRRLMLWPDEAGGEAG